MNFTTHIEIQYWNPERTNILTHTETKTHTAAGPESNDNGYNLESLKSATIRYAQQVNQNGFNFESDNFIHVIDPKRVVDISFKVEETE